MGYLIGIPSIYGQVRRVERVTNLMTLRTKYQSPIPRNNINVRHSNLRYNKQLNQKLLIQNEEIT